MAKELDNKKMWESILEELPESELTDAIVISLEKQGFQWNGKEIVSIEPEQLIKKGDWYMCLKDVHMDGRRDCIAYYRGKLYKSEEDGCLTNENGNKSHIWEYERLFKDYFRPATEDEIPHEPDSESTKKSDQELTEFEKALAKFSWPGIDLTSLTQDGAKLLRGKRALDVLEAARKQVINEAVDWLQRNINCSIWLLDFRKYMEKGEKL